MLLIDYQILTNKFYKYIRPIAFASVVGENTKRWRARKTNKGKNNNQQYKLITLCQ